MGLLHARALCAHLLAQLVDPAEPRLFLSQDVRYAVCTKSPQAQQARRRTLCPGHAVVDDDVKCRRVGQEVLPERLVGLVADGDSYTCAVEAAEDNARHD